MQAALAENGVPASHSVTFLRGFWQAMPTGQNGWRELPRA
jgi:hypothetical protein